MVIQPGGKFVIAGTSTSGSNLDHSHFLVARYTVTGALDTTLGPSNTGATELDLGGRDDVGAIAVGYLGTANNVSGEGNLIVSGDRDGQFAAVALRSDGHLDTRFSGDGILTTNIFGHATGLFTTGDYVAPVRRFVMAGDGGNVARYVDVGSHRSAAHLNNWRTIISRSETVFGDMPSSVSFFLSAR